MSSGVSLDFGGGMVYNCYSFRRCAGLSFKTATSLYNSIVRATSEPVNSVTTCQPSEASTNNRLDWLICFKGFIMATLRKVRFTVWLWFEARKLRRAEAELARLRGIGGL